MNNQNQTIEKIKEAIILIKKGKLRIAVVELEQLTADLRREAFKK